MCNFVDLMKEETTFAEQAERHNRAMFEYKVQQEQAFWEEYMKLENSKLVKAEAKMMLKQTEPHNESLYEDLFWDAIANYNLANLANALYKVQPMPEGCPPTYELEDPENEIYVIIEDEK